MFKKYVLVPFVAILTAIGLAALPLAGMMAAPLASPPPLASIEQGARAVDTSDAPALSYFTARDGTQLAYRVYAPLGAATGETAILIHGSAGHSLNKHLVAKALAKAGVQAVSVDMRGHGASGTRGDVAYIGQSEDDLADLLDYLKLPGKPALVGHSMGGGFALRVAKGPLGDRFSRYVLVSPFLGVDAPTSRPSSDGARWTEVDKPRIVALTILHKLGIDWGGSLPVLAFALSPQAQRHVTTRYSFRLLESFGPKDMRYQGLSGVAQPIAIIVGAKDELMYADRYADLAKGDPNVSLRVVEGVDHMGAARDPAALEAIVAATKGSAK